MKNSIREKQRFSIRKHKRIGAGSVLLGLTLIMMSLGGEHVQSEDLSAQESSSQNSSVQVSGNSVTDPVNDTDESNQEDNSDTQDISESNQADSEKSETCAVMITYTVVYVDESGQEIYRVTKSKTVTVQGDSLASSSVTEDGSGDLSSSALANYELVGGPASQVITENAENSLVVQVKAKTPKGESNKEDKAGAVNPNSIETSENSQDSASNLSSTEQNGTDSNQSSSTTKEDAVAKPVVDLHPEDSQPFVRNLMSASVAVTNSLDDIVTAPVNPTDSEIPSDLDEVADISGTGITEVNFYNEGQLVSTQYVKSGDYLLEPNVPGGQGL